MHLYLVTTTHNVAYRLPLMVQVNSIMLPLFEVFTMAWRAPGLGLFSPPPVSGTGHQVKVSPGRSHMDPHLMHALTTLSHCQLRLYCVYVCAAKHQVRDCE